MKMRVLGCQPRRGKDPCNRTYCRCKKIRVSTESQDLPPAIVLKRSKFLAILRGRERIWRRAVWLVLCLLFSLPAPVQRLCSILRRGCRNADNRQKRLCLAADPHRCKGFTDPHPAIFLPSLKF